MSKHKKKSSKRRNYSSTEEEQKIAKKVAKLVKRKLKRKKRSRRHSPSSSSESYSSSSRHTSEDSARRKYANRGYSRSRSRSSREDGRSETPENSIETPRDSPKQGTSPEKVRSPKGRSQSRGRAQRRKATDPPAEGATQETSTSLLLPTTGGVKSADGHTTPASVEIIEPNGTQPTSENTPVTKETESNKKLEKQTAENSLKENVLKIIGLRLKEDRILSNPVHSTFAVRWKEVLQLGLPKEERNELIKKYPPPQNCLFLDPPKLNKEISLSISESNKNRDQRIVAKQEKLQACIGGLAKVLAILLARDNDNDLLIIETLSDISRLTIDALHDETSIRRSLILANINVGVKDTLASTEYDEFLFGKNLSENLKQAKAAGQDAQALAKKSVSSNPPKNQRPPLRQLNRPLTEASSGQQGPAMRPHRSQQNQRRPQSNKGYSSQRSSHRSSYKSHQHLKKRY